MYYICLFFCADSAYADAYIFLCMQQNECVFCMGVHVSVDLSLYV